MRKIFSLCGRTTTHGLARNPWGAGGTLGRFTLPGTGPYSASKFTIESCSDARRMELAPYRVLVALVKPGVTDA